MNKVKISLLIILPLVLISSCGNQELTKALDNLNKAVANKDHAEIILFSDKVLSIDPENIDAISAYRDSARVYIHIKEASEAMLQLNDPTTADLALPFTADTPLDDSTVISYLQNFYNSEANKSITVDGKTGPSTDEAIKWLNVKHGLKKEDEATNVPSSSLMENVRNLEKAKLVSAMLNNLDNSVQLLSDAKKSLKKAERLDPRFRGVIDLEENINDRAEIFSFMIHYIFLSIYFTDIAITHAGYYDGVYGLMQAKLSVWRALDMYSMGPSDAYSYAIREADNIYSMLRTTSAIDMKSARKLLSIYKDLEDDFKELDSLEPAIELTEAIIDVMKLALEAKGSINDWSSAMSKAIDEYKDLSTDLVNEIDPLDELNEDKESIDSSIEDYLDEEVINALDKNIKFI